MGSTGRRVVLNLEKPFGDPDYDYLLDAFASSCPIEMERWKTIERDLFETRRGLGAYPDQDLRNTCLEFIREHSVDEVGGGLGRAWGVMCGRILRHLIDQTPALHPAPGKMLLTEPRTLTDEELVSIAESFSREFPQLWADWLRIESDGNFGDDPLGEVSYAFRRHVQDTCWVQCSAAITDTFLAVRGLVWGTVQRTH